ncbi:MAG: tubulin-like doman-containing protein, partial [Waddliaceae bacterium]
MEKPTLLIGLGTSGLKVVEEVQSFHYENTGRNKPNYLEYLYVETEESSYPEVTAQKNEIRRVPIKLEGVETMIKGLQKNPEIDGYWLPPAEKILEGPGAGGFPAFGRVALWGSDNFERVKVAIENAWERIAKYDSKETEDNKPAVFLTGSLTGGTGSGIFIDIAYMIRDIIDDIQEVYGLFLIPGRHSYGGRETIYCNTYAALNALNYYNDPNHVYETTWPNGRKAKFLEPPFQLVQLISQDYEGDIPPISTLTGLYRMAGLYLFLNIYGLRAKRVRRLTDAWNAEHVDKYGTFGLSAIQYPKAQLEEYLAINLSIQLLERWIDTSAYYSHGNKEQLMAREAIIHNKTRLRFEEILREAFTQLDAVTVGEGIPVLKDIETQARIINNKDHNEKSDYEFLYKLFTSQAAGNYYHALRHNTNLAEDLLIQRIQELISNSVQGFENLYLARVQLKAIVNAIDNCVNYWKSIRISGKPSKWESLLDDQIKWMLKGRYKFLFEQNNVLSDRIKSTLELMKMHLLANKIVEIRNNIVGGEYSKKTFQDSFELPRMNKIDEIINIIRKTIGTDVDKKDKQLFKTLKARKIEILDDIRDTTIPLMRIFPSITFDDEAKKSMHKYIRESGKSVPSKTSIIGERNLWDYLNQPKETLGKRLYNDCISHFEQALRSYRSVEDLDVSEYIEKEPENAQKMARRSISEFLKINPDKTTQFGSSMFIPKLVISSDQRSINRIVETFKAHDFLEFKNTSPDDYWVKEDLRNIVVFYDEKGYMSDKGTFDPLLHLRYIHEIEELYRAYPTQKSISEEEWHVLRNP